MQDNNWNQNRALNWCLFTPPARPSPGEVRVYDQLIQSTPIHVLNSWALLGSTPEIRSLAANYKKELYSIDRNADVFATLKTLVDKSYTEHFSCCDWLQAEPSEKMDVIFADGSMNMLPRSVHQPFLQKVHTMLNPDGWLLIRVHIADAPQFSSIKEIFQWYRQQTSNETVFTATRTHIDMLWAEPETLRINFQDYHRRFIKLKAEGIITEDEFEGYNKLIEYNKINLYYTTDVCIKQMIKGSFELIQICPGKDYTGYKNHPIYVLKKI